MFPDETGLRAIAEGGLGHPGEFSYGKGGARRMIFIDKTWLMENAPLRFNRELASTFAHEMTEAWLYAMSLDSEGGESEVLAAYTAEFWTNSLGMRRLSNPDEPTEYGQQYGPREALCEVAGLAVSDPGRLYYTRGNSNPGLARRQFLRHYMPFLRPLWPVENANPE